MNAKIEEYYQKIGLALARSAPAGVWEEAWVDVVVFEGGVHMKARYRDAQQGIEHNLTAPSQAAKLFLELHALTEESPRLNWRGAHFSIRRNGEFHIDYQYDEPSGESGSPAA